MVLFVIGVVALAGFVTAAVLVANSKSSNLQMTSADQLVTYSASHQVAPAHTTLQRLGGGSQVSVGGDTGHPMIVNFFASWCPACQRELSAVATVARENIVPFVGVDTDDTSAAKALSLLHKAGATFPVGVGVASLAERYGAHNLPTTAFVNAKGKVVALYLGALNRTDLTRWAEELARTGTLSRP